MPAYQQSYENFVAANVPTTNATETVICTTRSVNSPFLGASFSILFVGMFTAGAGTTSVTFRIRQTSLTGTAVATFTAVLIAAATVAEVSFAAVDGTVLESTGALWVLTAIQAAGAAPGAYVNGYSRVCTPV